MCRVKVDGKAHVKDAGTGEGICQPAGQPMGLFSRNGNGLPEGRGSPAPCHHVAVAYLAVTAHHSKKKDSFIDMHEFTETI